MQHDVLYRGIVGVFRALRWLGLLHVLLWRILQCWAIDGVPTRYHLLGIREGTDRGGVSFRRWRRRSRPVAVATRCGEFLRRSAAATATLTGC
jgi:hypothetical protein